MNERRNRDHFRIEYPPGERPKISLAGKTFPIHNLSESGVLFSFNIPIEDFELDMRVEATIHLRNNSTFQVQGEIMRVMNNKVAVRLDNPIPFQIIMAEQRYLIAKFGTIKVPDAV
ncbi:MAG: PilZ domain-containing protein [Oligoflexales bacterium]